MKITTPIMPYIYSNYDEPIKFDNSATIRTAFQNYKSTQFINIQIKNLKECKTNDKTNDIIIYNNHQDEKYNNHHLHIDQEIKQ
mmetsp:Transcript_25116/g.45266  ORF Transcript_25116/g.45266 Transcript_25116/m.45266 type:complete len:84 (-) Transcript_25116:770-1021(-)